MPTPSRRPSPAFIVSIVALAVALTGSASAHALTSFAQTISGSNITAHSITGVRLKNNTLTGKQIKESALGTVPKADSAATLGGIPASGFVHGTQISRRITQPTGTSALSRIVSLPGLGGVFGNCVTAPGIEYDNTTSETQQVSVTFTDEASGPAGSNSYDFHGPWDVNTGVSHSVSGPFSMVLTGLTQAAKPKAVSLTVLAYTIDDTCVFDLVGQSTL